MDYLEKFLDVRQMLANFLQEDVGAADITSEALIPKNLAAKGEIVCKSDYAIVCGLEEASMLFEICGCSSETLVRDGSKIKE
ncbi:MAG: hypothetical protein M3247_05155, partial [Thermoproteota archaeon]|nr:hypothetical protein [Thermoproteota archaeon]